jgi:ABC-2 type transport system ATP-binding protein
MIEMVRSMNKKPKKTAADERIVSSHSGSVRQVIHIENLNKSFKIDFWKKKNHVLKDVSFAVREGEIYGFLGHNGAGKTTTIKILNNLISRDSGKVELWGKDPSDNDIKKNIGYLPENPVFYDHLTGREFLEFYAELHRIPLKARKTRTSELLETVGLTGAANMKMKKYSKGMIQRVALAQALVNDPALLILDEPLSGLDPIGRYEVREIILDQSRRGKTVFFSSHLLSDVEIICDFVTILVNGRVVSTGKIDDLVSKEIESWDVTVSIEDISKIAKEKDLIHSLGNEHLVRIFNEDNIEILAKKVYANKGKIRSVIPNKKTLEELFISEMKKGGME